MLRREDAGLHQELRPGRSVVGVSATRTPRCRLVPGVPESERALGRAHRGSRTLTPRRAPAPRAGLSTCSSRRARCPAVRLDMEQMAGLEPVPPRRQRGARPHELHPRRASTVQSHCSDSNREPSPYQGDALASCATAARVDLAEEDGVEPLGRSRAPVSNRPPGHPGLILPVAQESCVVRVVPPAGLEPASPVRGHVV